MAMTADERKENNLNKLLLSVSAQIDREESDYPQKEINQARKTLIKNSSNMYSSVEIENYLQDERDTRAEAKKEQALNANPLLEKRQIRAEGGSLLTDDREQYAEGKDVEMTLDDMPTDKKWEKAYNQYLSLPKDVKNKNKMAYDVAGDRYLLVPNRVKEDILQPENEINYDIISINRAVEVYSTREKKAEGGDLHEQMEGMMEEPTHTMPDGTEMEGATHGEYDEQMESLMDKETPMLPDEEMEEDYVDYVMNETLSDEDKNYLMSTLEQDDRLSMIFDQVVESATEFSGSGPIDGPGTETSDSIPARLSDGEFVFTAKATEEIGVDNLMSMMKDAESGADGRQELNLGGKPTREEETDVDQFGKPIDSNPVDDEIRKGMLSTNPRLK